MDKENFLNGAFETLLQLPLKITVGKHIYKVRQVSQAVRFRIMKLELECQMLEKMGKEGTNVKTGIKIARKLFSLHSKEAAYYLLGNWAIFCPWLWWLEWRILQFRGEETTFQINSIGAIGSDLGFSKANWQLSRQARELYMRPVGEVAKESQERLESVLNMLEKDALGIKEGDK